MAEFDPNVLVEALKNQTDAIKEIMQEKTAASTQTANPLHGANGLIPIGVERDVITAHVRPYGLFGALPAYPSVTEDPRFFTITGFTAESGARILTSCADAPTRHMKGAALTARFGLTRKDTNTIEMDKLMLKANRGDMTDLVLRGQVLGLTLPELRGLNQSQMLNILTMSEMIGVGVAAERELVVDTWQGTVAQGSFPGLDSQIATGHMDADTGVVAPALDSNIMDFGYSAVDGTTRDIVEYLSSMEYYLFNSAETMGLNPVQWAIVMRPEIWYELSAVWPCRYNTSRCSNSAGNNIAVMNDDFNVRMRDEMRKGMTIDINGRTHRVILDVGIYESNNINTAGLVAGQYASTIYMIPLTIQGNYPVTYREYLDYSRAATDVALLNNTEPFFWTDNGMFTWAVEYVKWCYKLSLKTEQRIVLRTPQLAGKLQKIKYTPLQHLRDALPDSPYWKDGGVSIRNHTWGQAVWANSR